MCAPVVRTPCGGGRRRQGESAGADPARPVRTLPLQDLRKPGLFARFLQALSGTQQGDDGEGGSGPSSGPSSGGSGSSGGAKGAEGGRQARGEQPPASSAATGSQEPPSGMQLAIVAAGLAALPVVGWSEWVLKSTGACLGWE